MENQAYISRVHLKGYKSIRDMEIDFMPGLNIIIGPNGSGKTNFLECLDENTKAFILLDNAFFYLEFFVNQSKYSISRTFKSKFISVNNAGKFIEEITLDNKLIHKNEGFVGINQNGRKNSSFEHWQAIANFSQIPMTTLASHKFIKYGYSTNISMFSKPFSFNSKDTNEIIMELANEGNIILEKLIMGIVKVDEQNIENLNSESINEIFELEKILKSALLNYTPINDIRIKQDFTITKKENSVDINSLIYEFRINNQWFTWKQLSDGTKRIIQIIFEVCKTDENPLDKIVFIEEPELGIHPNQLSRLMDFLREQSREKQIIITTHSPQVLNELGADELNRIIVTRYEGERGTQMYHLSEEEKGFAKGYMENGAFLSDYWVQSGFMNEEEIV